jgi:hypothetical protein
LLSVQDLFARLQNTEARNVAQGEDAVGGLWFLNNWPSIRLNSLAGPFPYPHQRRQG